MDNKNTNNLDENTQNNKGNISNDANIEDKKSTMSANSSNNDNCVDSEGAKANKDKHILTMPNNGKTVEITKDTNFGSKNKFQECLLNVGWFFAVNILWVYCKLFLGLKIEGKENYKQLREKKKGFLVISNHIHVMDTPMVAVTLKPHKLQFTSIESNFAIPVAGKILSFFNVIPMPENPFKLKIVFDYINKAVGEGKVVHLFPEGVLLPYNNKLKRFNRGAFVCAERAKCDILPIVYTQRKAKGPFKYLKKYRCSYTAHILPALELDQSLNRKDAINDIESRARAVMEETLQKYDENVISIDYSEFK